mgnify:CR=1 FL=1
MKILWFVITALKIVCHVLITMNVLNALQGILSKMVYVPPPVLYITILLLNLPVFHVGSLALNVSISLIVLLAQIHIFTKINVIQYVLKQHILTIVLSLA